MKRECPWWVPLVFVLAAMAVGLCGCLMTIPGPRLDSDYVRAGFDIVTYLQFGEDLKNPPPLDRVTTITSNVYVYPVVPTPMPMGLIPPPVVTPPPADRMDIPPGAEPPAGGPE